MKKYFFVSLWLAFLALAAAKYPPGQRWREVERNGFTVIFPAARPAEAMAALAAAETSSEELSSFWRFRLPSRVRIVLNDATDQSNGFATFYPFNLIGANLAEPPPDSELATRFGSLDLIMDHELTHLFTMNAGSPPLCAARRIFGSLPLLYPAVQLPPWVIEGLAVEGESCLTGDGRLNHPPYRLMLEAARRDGMFPNWSRIAGMPTTWPGATSKYLFGAGFMEFLAEKYGGDSLRKYLERSTSRLVLFSSSRDFKRTFGEPLSALWHAYKESVPVAAGPAPEPLTKNGFLHQYPCPLGTDRLAYYRRDYRSRGAAEILDLQSGRVKVLFNMDAVNGLSFSEKENKIYLSAVDYFHASSDFSDLYEYDMKKGQLKRLSCGGRLSQPAKKENSSGIFCVQRRDGRYYLARFDMEKGQVHAISRPFSGMAQPAISPDGTMIAAAVKPANEPWGIAIFTDSGQLLTFRTIFGSNLSQPCWRDNKTVLFIMSGEESTALGSFSLDKSSGGYYQDPCLVGLQQFGLSQDGREIFFTYYSGRGREIAKLDFTGLAFQPAEITTPVEISAAASTVPATLGRPYRFWRDLLPRYWAASWRKGGDEFQAGIMTGGQDALGIHGFSLEGYYGFSSHRANVSFNYTYDGLFPTLSLSYSDNSDFFNEDNYTQRSQELKLASLWPLRVRRHSRLFGYADLHLERRFAIYKKDTYKYRSNFNGFSLGLEFNSAREYYDSISPADGVRFTLQYSHQPAGMGNEFDSSSAQADLRHFMPLFRPGVLAWRLVGARSWSDPFGFTMGGLEGEAGSSLGKNHPFDLLRGFPADNYDRGKGGYLFNLEYRLPLLKIEKAILPAVSLDRVYLVPFFDMGRLWHGSYSGPTAYSIGAEAVLRVVFGGAAFSDLSFGAAYGFGLRRSWCIYLRTGRSF